MSLRSGNLTLLAAIGEIVRPDLQRPGAIRLEEADEGSHSEPIILKKFGQAVVLKPDGAARPAGARFSVNERMFPWFRTDLEGLTAACDYIIFYQDKGEEDPALFVFLCELKSANLNGAEKQAENGRLVADYILAMASHHRPVRAPRQILYRGLIFGSKCKSLKADPYRVPCAYEAPRARMPDLRVAYYPCGGSYPLSHFCA